MHVFLKAYDFSLEEVVPRKATDMAGVVPEYLKNSRYTCLEWMVKMFDICLNSGLVPNERKVE